MKRLVFIFLVALLPRIIFAQDSRKIFQGKYGGIQKQTNVPGSIFYDYGASAKVIMGDSTTQNVFFYDSCSWAQNWTGAPGNFKAWPDSTIRAMGNSSVIYGRLYPNDSLYFKYVLTGGPTTTTEEFFGFKVKTGVGLDEKLVNNASFRVYPNPASNKLTVKGIEGSKMNHYFLSSIDGKKIQLLQIADFEYDVSTIPQGLYLLKLETEKGILTKKIAIQH